MNLLKRLPRAFMFKRLGRIAAAPSEEESKRLYLLDVVRSHTLAVRNWAYADQMFRITKELFSPIEDDFEGIYGLRINHLIDMLLKIIQISEERLNNHIKALRPMVKEKEIPSIIRKFHRGVPGPISEDELCSTIEGLELSPYQVKSLLVHLSDTLLTSIYTFNLDDFVDAYDSHIKRENISEILNKLSLELGDLAGYELEHLFLDNPVWYRPIIRIEEDEYVWPLLSVFISFCLSIFESLIATSDSLKERYEKHRAVYLESSVAKYFREAFPTAEIYRGSCWRDKSSGKEYENDLTLLVDSHLIVVEAKSGRITPPALRGAELRLENTIKKLITEPSRQISRFLEILLGDPGVHEFPTKSGQVNVIDTSGVRQVIRLNVTLAPMNLVGVNWASLKEAGYMPEDVDLTPVIGLSDLEVIFEILEGECEKLHYLSRRADIEANTNYVGEEIDLLGFYRETGFNIGDAEFNKTPLFIGMLSKTFDNYYLRKSRGEKAIKPRCKRSKWWQDLLDKVEDRKPLYWSEMGKALHNFPYEQQVELERGFKDVQQNVKRNWKVPNHINHVELIVGPDQRKSALIAVAYISMPRKERHEMIKQYASAAAEHAGVSQVLVIGQDLDSGDYPYSFLGLLEHKQMEDNEDIP